MAPTADTWVPHAATEPPIPLLSLPVHCASGLLRSDRREGAEVAPGRVDRTDDRRVHRVRCPRTAQTHEQVSVEAEKGVRGVRSVR